MEGVSAGGTGHALPSRGIDGRFQWVDCSSIKVDATWTADGKPGATSPAILGAAFAASSQEDGGGEPILGFQEAERGGSPWVKALDRVIIPPEVHELQDPKEMLLPLGYVPGMIQQTHGFAIHRLGGLVIASLGFEPTITSGLRIRRTIAEALDVPIHLVIVQGYVNGYGHYLTTPEEYDQQDYEGGATIFGRNQLPAFQQVFHGLAKALKEGEPVDVGEPAGDLTGMIPASPVGNPWLDLPPLGKNFGDVLASPAEIRAGESARVEFVGANPNNNLRHGEGYLTVENEAGGVIANDSSESTQITFRSELGTTRAICEWDSTGVEPGLYQVVYKGDARALTGAVNPFEGRASFRVS